jgi:NADH:ubiquinone oxidoreductase subunit E
MIKMDGQTKLTICLGKTCRGNFSDDIAKEVEKYLKCSLFDETADGKFATDSALCMRNCEHGPSVKFNEYIFSHMTPKEVKQIVIAIENEDHDFINAVFSEAKKRE